MRRQRNSIGGHRTFSVMTSERYKLVDLKSWYQKRRGRDSYTETLEICGHQYKIMYVCVSQHLILVSLDLRVIDFLCKRCKMHIALHTIFLQIISVSMQPTPSTIHSVHTARFTCTTAWQHDVITVWQVYSLFNLFIYLFIFYYPSVSLVYYIEVDFRKLCLHQHSDL